MLYPAIWARTSTTPSSFCISLTQMYLIVSEPARTPTVEEFLMKLLRHLYCGMLGSHQDIHFSCPVVKILTQSTYISMVPVSVAFMSRHRWIRHSVWYNQWTLLALLSMFLFVGFGIHILVNLLYQKNLIFIMTYKHSYT